MTGAVDSVDGEVVYGVPSRSRWTMNVVAAVPVTRPPPTGLQLYHDEV